MIQGSAPAQEYHREPVDSPSSSPPPGAGKSGTLAALAIALLLPAGLAAQVAQPLGGLLWTEIFVFLLPAMVVTAGSNLDARAWLRLRAPSPGAALLGLLTGVAAWVLGSALFAALRALAPSALVERYDLSRLFEGPAVLQAAFTAAAVIVAPLCEEVAFRGHVAAAYHSRHRPAVAIGASAFVFALLHLDPLRGPALFALGLVYGWLAWRSGSIWPAVIAHAVNNAIAATLALSMGTAGNEPTLPWALGGVAVGAALLALVVALLRTAPAPSPEPLRLADPGDPSAEFELRRVPRSLLVGALAGAVTLLAIVLPRVLGGR